MGPTFSEVVNRGRCFSSCHERGTKEKNLSPHEESNLMETQNFFLCPMLVTRRKNIFLYFFTELKTYYLWLIIFTK